MSDNRSQRVWNRCSRISSETTWSKAPAVIAVARCTRPASVPLASPGTAFPKMIPATPESPTIATRTAAERAPRNSRKGSATAAVSGAWWARIASCMSVARSLDCTTASRAIPSTTEWKTSAMNATSAATRRPCIPRRARKPGPRTRAPASRIQGSAKPAAIQMSASNPRVGRISGTRWNPTTPKAAAKAKVRVSSRSMGLRRAARARNPPRTAEVATRRSPEIIARCHRCCALRRFATGDAGKAGSSDSVGSDPAARGRAPPREIPLPAALPRARARGRASGTRGRGRKRCTRSRGGSALSPRGTAGRRWSRPHGGAVRARAARRRCDRRRRDRCARPGGEARGGAAAVRAACVGSRGARAARAAAA